MIHTFTHIIKILCISYIVFPLFLSTLYANDNSSKLINIDEDEEKFILDLQTFPEWEALKNSHKEIFPLSYINPTTRYLEFTRKYYWKFKEDNFKDYNIKDRIILLYLHTILDKLLDSNKDLLSKYGRDDIKQFFPLERELTHNKKDSSIAGAGKDYIRVYINSLFPEFINDASIASFLSHEIAHILLNHNQKSIDKLEELKNEYIKKYKNDEDTKIYLNVKNNNLDLDYDMDNETSRKYIVFSIKMNQYSNDHPDYLDFRRKQEIEADNLGFIIYLNAGFSTEYYPSFYLHNLDWKDKNPYSTFPFSLEIKEQLSKGLTLDNSQTPFKDSYYLRIKPLKDFLTNLESKQKEYISNLINTNKYEKNIKNEHPTPLWRYWNLRNQEQKKKSRNNKQAINNNNLNIVYFKIDLSNLDKLDKIKEFFSKYKTMDLDHNNIEDPKVYIINKLLLDNSNINFKLELLSTDQKDIGIIKDDNTMLLRANDIFQIAYLLLKKENPKSFSSCTKLFENERSLEEFEEYLNQLIRSSFI